MAGNHTDRSKNDSHWEQNREFYIGLARAFGGAIIFALPMLMTAEMWWLGFYMDRFRLVLFIVLMLPLLVGISHFSGFRVTVSWWDDLADALVAYGVGLAASTIVLAIFNVINLEMPPREIIGKIVIQAIPASFGAIIANGQLHSKKAEQKEDARKGQASYGGEMLLMAAGAVFLGANIAPTEEMNVIAFKMTHWHAVGLILISLVLMHAFVYSVDFSGQHLIPEDTPGWSIFLRYTAAGYFVAIIISVYILWTFGRYEDNGLSANLIMAVVLGFPASIGAAAARLVL